MSEEEAVDDMLSWRFRAGMAAVILLIMALFAFGTGDPAWPTTLVVLGPLVLTCTYTWRYVRARRDLVAEGLWPND